MSSTTSVIHRNGIDILVIDNNRCHAELSLFGGHLLQWQPSGQRPVFWVSETATLDGSGAIRGGVPVCWPWFGVVDGKGRHGLVRTRSWQLDDCSEQADHTSVSLSITLDRDANRWNHPQRLEMQLRLGETLDQTLIMHNTSDQQQVYTGALHSYFAVSAPENIRIPVLKGAQYYDHIKVEHGLTDDGNTPYRGPIDRIYGLAEDAVLIDEGWNRRIEISKSGAAQWVLWNPGNEAEGIDDIHPGGEHGFLCFETAQTAELGIAPGASAQMRQVIRVVQG